MQIIKRAHSDLQDRTEQRIPWQATHIGSIYHRTNISFLSYVIDLVFDDCPKILNRIFSQKSWLVILPSSKNIEIIFAPLLSQLGRMGVAKSCWKIISDMFLDITTFRTGPLLALRLTSCQICAQTRLFWWLIVENNSKGHSSDHITHWNHRQSILGALSLI